MQGVTLSWAGGEHKFALPLGRLRQLQDTCNAGPEEIFGRLRVGNWRVDDVIETLRVGLIGGGMQDREAAALVKRISEQGDLVGLKMTAIAVLMSALFSPEGDELGETEGAGSPAPENGSFQTSTETAQ